MEDRNSLFTPAEREAHAEAQIPLIAKAKQGNFKPLLAFWAAKKNLFQQRAFDRNYNPTH